MRKVIILLLFIFISVISTPVARAQECTLPIVSQWEGTGLNRYRPSTNYFISNEFITLNWTDIEGALYYTVEISYDGGNTWSQPGTNLPFLRHYSESQYTGIIPVQYDETVQLRIRAFNLCGGGDYLLATSEPLLAAYFTTPQLYQIAAGYDSVTLAYSDVPEAGSYFFQASKNTQKDLYGYYNCTLGVTNKPCQDTYAIHGSPTTDGWIENTDNDTVTLTGIACGVTYNAHIFAGGNGNISPWSTDAAFSTAACPEDTALVAPTPVYVNCNDYTKNWQIASVVPAYVNGDTGFTINGNFPQIVNCGRRNQPEDLDYLVYTFNTAGSYTDGHPYNAGDEVEQYNESAIALKPVYNLPGGNYQFHLFYCKGYTYQGDCNNVYSGSVSFASMVGDAISPTPTMTNTPTPTLTPSLTPTITPIPPPSSTPRPTLSINLLLPTLKWNPLIPTIPFVFPTNSQEPTPTPDSNQNGFFRFFTRPPRPTSRLWR